MTDKEKATLSTEERVSIQIGGLNWLSEMELIEDPQFINNLKLNILSVSNQIREVEMLSFYLQGKKDMLIWLDLKWWGRAWTYNEIKEDVEFLVSQILPNFRFRITTDYNIMRMAAKRIVALHANKV